MSTLAFLMRMTDGPGIPDRQLQLCIYLPIASIVISWCLIRRKKWLAIPALAIAAIIALIILRDVFDSMTRFAMFEDFGWSYVLAIVLSAVFPFVAVAIFYFQKRNRPNQSPEPTPTTVTPPARQEARQP
jgi:uncharacterized membrane protein